MRKSFHRYYLSAAKGRPGKMWAHCQIGQETWWQRTWKKTEVLKSLLLVFTDKIYLQESQVPETGGKGGSKVEIPLMEKDQVRECLSKPNVPMPMGPGKLHHELGGTVVVILRPLLTVLKKSWVSQETP